MYSIFVDKVNKNLLKIMENYTNPVIFSRKTIAKEIAYIFDVNVNYVSRLLKFERINFDKGVNLTNLLSKSFIKFTDLVSVDFLCDCARAIFFLAGDENDKKIHDFHSLFVSRLHDNYEADVDNYAEEMKTRCKDYGINNLPDYMQDYWSELQVELDGSAEEDDDELP